MAKKKSNHRISIRSIRRNPPDLSKLGRALIALAMAEAEAEAEAQAQSDETQKRAESTSDPNVGDES